MSEINQIHRDFIDKKTDPVEILSSHRKRVESSQLNAVVTPLFERAAAKAEAAQAMIVESGAEAFRDRPLLGIPIGVKDLFTLENEKTTCCSKILEHYESPYSSEVVQRLESAGAIIVAKLNMDEFAMGGSNENSAFGPVEHPTHPGHVPGGSSGGSAAAVKAELCTASIGTDTGGSIRLPASFCGVVGIKPTYGRVSRFGMIAFASSLDQGGTFGRNVEDAVRVLEVISGHDEKDSTSAPVEHAQWSKDLDKIDWKKVRVGVPKEYFGDGIDSEVAESVNDCVEYAVKQGAKRVDVTLPHTQYAIATYYLIATSEASSNLSRFDGVRFGTRVGGESGDFYGNNRSLFGEEVKRRILLGTFALSSGYYDAYYKKSCQLRRLIQKDFTDAFEKVDLILGPVAPTPAFKKGERTQDPLKMYMSDVLTVPASLAGLPAMSLPVGESSTGLPIGLQLIGPAFNETLMLQAASSIEKGRA